MTWKQRFIRIVGVLIIIELFLQVLTFARFAWGTFAKKQAERDMVTRTWALRDPTFRAVYSEEANVWEDYEPFIGWHTRELHTPHINVSSDGIRNTVGNPVSSVTGLSTIYFFGGSAMWGEGHADDTTIPSLIATQLNASAAKVNIINYGEIGYGSTQEVLRLALLLKSGKRPDKVVFYDGCNDFFLSTLDTKPHETFRDERMKSVLGNIWALQDDSEKTGMTNTTVFSKSFWSYIQIIRYPIEIYNSIIRTATQKTTEVVLDDPGKTAAIAQNYLGNIKLLDALSREYHFDYLLFWQPTVYSREMSAEEKNLPDIHPDRYPQLSQIYRDTARTIGQELGDKFIDVSDTFTGVTDSIFTDTCHVTVQGNTLVSKEITDVMRRTWGIGAF